VLAGEIIEIWKAGLVSLFFREIILSLNKRNEKWAEYKTKLRGIPRAGAALGKDIIRKANK